MQDRLDRTLSVVNDLKGEAKMRVSLSGDVGTYSYLNVEKWRSKTHFA
jgi:hypothetical protein